MHTTELNDVGTPAPHEGPDADTPAGLAPTVTAAPFRELVLTLERDAALDRYADALGRLAGRVAQGRRRDLLLGVPLGHALHPLMTDLPLGCWTSASLLDLVGGRSARSAARRLVGIGLLGSAPTALSGLTEFGELRRDRDRRVATVHAGGNVVGMTCQALSWRARRRDHHVRGTLWTVAGNVVLSATGYLGGHLSFARGVGVADRMQPPAPSSVVAEAPQGAGQLLGG